jgi:predicted DNA-binding transcriptional regulator AlpA
MATHSTTQVDLSSPPVEAIHSQSALLDGYLRREELAQQFGVSPRTIDRWHSLRNGPPRISIGRTILYRLDSVHEWLQEQESAPLSQRDRRGPRIKQRFNG